jgi:hypothetical protein
MIDRAHDLPITKQAKALKISRGSGVAATGAATPNATSWSTATARTTLR